MRALLIIILWVALAVPAQARIWHVEVDGSGDVPTIAAGIDSSTVGDVIELGCGVYFEWGLVVKSGTTIRSETGEPGCVTIDGDQPSGFGSILSCWAADNSTLVEGLTITGGMARDPFYGSRGGGLLISTGSFLTVKHCVIMGNYAKSGGGVSISTSHPVFIDCEISGNESMFYPGGVEVGLESSFTAYRTSVLANLGGTGFPDGSVRAGSEALLNCCEIETGNWLFEGSVVIDETDCGQVETEMQSWGSVKGLFR